MIEALTACLDAVGHSSPTLVGEGLSGETVSSCVVYKIHDSSGSSFILFSGLVEIFPGHKSTCMHPL